MAYHILRMYHQARGFQLAAERCLEERDNPEQRTLPIQAIVNCAFACEVYLKAIYAFEHPEADKLWGHHLDELYNQLPDAYKVKIENNLSFLYKKEDVGRLLQEFRKIFEEYRYIYEMEKDNRIHYGFVLIFASALQDIVGELTHKYVLRMAEMGGAQCW